MKLFRDRYAFAPRYLGLILSMVLLASCATAGAATQAPATANSAPGASAADSSQNASVIAAATGPAGTSISTLPPATPASTYTDPFAYCAAIGTIDAPGPEYAGSAMPDVIAKALQKASGASADMPLEIFKQGSFWRCMDGKVYGCFVGANLPCTDKANTNRTPTAAENDYCKANPSSDFIPAAVTGHDTVYEWRCQNGGPEIAKQVFQVDSSGYISEIWYLLSPQ